MSVAIIFLNGIHPTSEPELFRWDISVTQKPPAVTNAEASQVKEMPSKPKDNTLQKRSEMNSDAQRERRVIESRPVLQPVQSQVPVKTRESQPTTRTVQAQVIPQETVHLQTTAVREMEAVNKTAETRTVETTAAPLEENIVTHDPKITRQDTVLESDKHPIVTAQVIEESAVSAVVERTPASDSVVEARIVETPVPLETASVQTKQDIESTITESDLNDDQTQAATTIAQVSSPLVQTSPDGKASALPEQQASLKSVPLQSNPGARADYGWLREALWSRIERLKGYPYIARTNRWEGLVILEAVINNEGQLIGLKIVESSGHAALDRDAMEVMRKSCPIHLKHALGKSEVKLQVPISYKLR